MTNSTIIAKAKQFIDGKDFFLDTMYSKKLKADYIVICFTINDYPDYIRLDNFLVMIEPDNQKL